MLSIILPTYNESENIRNCIIAIQAVLSKIDYEIIVADDNSPDGTGKIVQGLNDPRVKLLLRTTGKGLGPAVVSAFEIAKGSVYAVMDADMQHDESILPVMLDKLKTNDLVIGSRKCPGGSFGEFPWSRKFTSWVATFITRKYLGLEMTDPMTGYFMLKRETYERARKKMLPIGFKILLEIYCCAQPLKYAEVGFTFRNRLAGRSKLSFHVVLELLKSLARYRSDLRRNSPQKHLIECKSTSIVSE